MKLQHRMSVFAHLAVAFLLGATYAQDSFEPITTSDLGTVTSIDIGLSCGTEEKQQIPNTMFTIAPGATGSGVVISSSPANLVSASSSNGNISLEWNNAVANIAFGGGVRIEVPADTLKSVTVRNAATAQVLEGFTSITRMNVSGASTVKANLSTSSAGSSQTLNVGGASTVNIDSNVRVTGKVEGASLAKIGTTSYDNFDVSGASTVGVAGDVGSGSVSGASKLTASGTTTGSINASGASTVAAANCGGVSTSGASSCKQRRNRVSVNTNEAPAKRTGNYQCGGWGWHDGGNDWDRWNAAPALMSLYSVMATSMAAVMLASFLSA